MVPSILNQTGLPRAFLRDREGATAIELAFALPILLTVLTGIVQFGALFFLQNHMGDIARDTARRVSVGQMSASEAETYAQGELVTWKAAFAVDVQDLSDEVTVAITVPMADASLVDIFGLFETGNLRARVEMPRE